MITRKDNRKTTARNHPFYARAARRNFLLLVKHSVIGCFGALALLVAAKALAQAPAPVTVEQAVSEAIERNLNLLAERFNLTLADARIATARLRPNPVLSIGGDHLDLLGTGYNNINSAGPPEYALRTDFILERGEKRRSRIEVAQLEKQVAELQLLNTMRTLVFDVQGAFVDVLSAKDALRLAEDNLASFKRILEVNTQRVRAGDLAQVELVRTQLAEMQLNNAAVQARTRLALSRRRLQLLMGRPFGPTLVDAAGELRRDALAWPAERLPEIAFAQRPDYLALQRDQARSQADIRLQIAQRKIDYTVGAEYRRQQGLAGRGNSLGVFLTIPIPLFDRNQGEIERARQEQLRIEAQMRALEAEIRTEIAAAQQQFDTARELLDRIEGDMLAKARRVLSTMEYSYRSGEASFVELLDAQRAFNDAVQSFNEARAEYARSLYLLDSIIGGAAR
ncbi:MAG: TolC family protein [Acidobacteria bacterium]|nr:TolC family protein [Acidobacteriota bacterium]MCW5969348.1 TolC family protein [Blastocatellales bacterium]